MVKRYYASPDLDLKTTTNKSFRLSKAALNVIEQEAEARGVTPSAIVNDLLVRYAFYDIPTRKYEPLSIGVLVMRKLCSAIPEEAMMKLAEDYASDPLLYHILEETGDSSIDGIVRSMKAFSDTGALGFSEDKFEGARTIILTNSIGKNWSIFTAVIWKKWLEKAGIKAETTANDEATIIRFL